MKKRPAKKPDRFQKVWQSLDTPSRLLGAIGLLALFTRLYKIVNKELWFDEVLDIIQAQKSIPEIFFDVKITPLHYLFVHFFALVSSNIEWLRLPSVIFGVGSVVLLYYTVRKIADSRAALFSSFLLALSPMTVEFSQQILHYSYFVFFTILTLYFYADLLFERPLRLRTVILFIAASLLNITTHLSAFLVLQLQGIFFVLYVAGRPKLNASRVTEFFRIRKNAIAALAFFAAVALLATRVPYIHVFKNYSQFNPKAPIPLGYSLVSQLKSEVLTDFTPAFFIAMFSWFGNGGGWQLVLFVTLSVIGIASLLKRRFWAGAFTLVWIAGPFILLHIARISHWFEEKYFIFVVPVYLFTVACGVIALIDSIASRFKDTSVRTLLYVLAVLAFLMLSVHPLNTRTTYGYIVEGDQQFSWKQAIDSVRDKMGDDDRIMAIDDKFLKAYMGRENRNKTWISEEDLIHYTPEDYRRLVSANYVHYYLSIPDIVDMRIGPLITYSHEGAAGGFNAYRINFQKSSPVEFTGTYIENFMKMNYLRDAVDWNNVIMSYNADINAAHPQTEVENLIYLVPKNNNDPYIKYTFKLTGNDPLYLRVNSFAKKQAHIAVEVTKNGERVALNEPLSVQKKLNFTDELYDLSALGGAGELGITFSFTGLPGQYTNQLEAGLKSFGLVTRPYADPVLEAKEDGSFVYDANLEIGKDKKWWTETYRNFGWVQTRFGILYRLAGDDADSLVYRFVVPPGVSRGTLMTETFTSNNAMNVWAGNSPDEGAYRRIARHENELKEIEHTYPVPPDLLRENEYLYVKVQSDKQGQFGALRNLVLTLK